MSDAPRPPPPPPRPRAPIERHPDLARMRDRVRALDAADPDAARERREEDELRSAQAELAALVGRAEAHRLRVLYRSRACNKQRNIHEYVLESLENEISKARGRTLTNEPSADTLRPMQFSSPR